MSLVGLISLTSSTYYFTNRTSPINFGYMLIEYIEPTYITVYN